MLAQRDPHRQYPLRVTLSKRRLKIGIDFRVDEPRQGVGTAVLALLHGLSRLQQTEQEYILLVQERHADFFRPYVSGSCSIVGVPAPAASHTLRWKAKLRNSSVLHWLWTKVRPAGARLPASDGIAEQLGCALVHFPSQIGYTTTLPTIYQPWDLQHRHYPEFFSPQDIRTRDTQYRAFCERASSVCVQTEWTKQDVVTQYGINPNKIAVMRWGTAFEAYLQPSLEETERIRAELALPELFFLYPAVCWPHKNHAVILRALALLQSYCSQRLHVVFTGAASGYQTQVEALARELGVSDAIRFLGFTTSSQLQTLFHLATALLFPSRFEGLGLPVLEAFRAGLPVISSNATVLPEVTGGAALLFDPDSPEELASGIEALLASSQLRARLIKRGKQVVEDYSVDATAQDFFELYRKVAEPGSI